MFSRIAPRYDFLNHFLSVSFDKLWRKRTARQFSHILSRPDARVLDLCCGTGDLVFAFERRARQLTQPVTVSFSGADFALPMLQLAAKKNQRFHGATKFLAADALALPFPDASFDLVASAFGFRNLANYEHGLHEIKRVLRPGGEAGILEFCQPRSGALSALYNFYFRRILPRVGGAISGSSEAYSYLPSSVQKFPDAETLKSWMERAGFSDVKYERWTFGGVALHCGRR